MEILTNFGIQPILLLAQIVNFLIIFFLLKRFFYAPIVKMLNQRKKTIEESLKNAEEIEAKLTQTQEESARILEEAQNRAEKLIDDAQNQADTISQKASADARKTIEETLIQAKEQINAQKVQMQKDLESEMLTLVAEVVKKVLGRNLNAKEKASLTEKSISQLTKSWTPENNDSDAVFFQIKCKAGDIFGKFNKFQSWDIWKAGSAYNPVTDLYHTADIFCGGAKFGFINLFFDVF